MKKSKSIIEKAILRTLRSGIKDVAELTQNLKNLEKDRPFPADTDPSTELQKFNDRGF